MASTFSIRNTLLSDLPAIAALDAKAFQQYSDAPVPERSVDSLMLSLSRNPKGCFLAEKEGEPVGFIFSRIWGQTGWLGTFGVEPKHKGHGIGKELYQSSLRQLIESRCTRIGLETMSNSSYNIGMYLRFGFHLIEPTLVLEKSISSQPRAEGPMHFHPVDYQTIADLSGRIPGLDYSVEARCAEEHGWGESFLLSGNSQEDFRGEPFGFVTIRTQPLRGKAPSRDLHVQCAVINEVRREKLARAIEMIESKAFSGQFQRVILPVHSANREATKWLLDMGFTIQRTAARMLHTGSYAPSAVIDFGRWAM